MCSPKPTPQMPGPDRPANGEAHLLSRRYRRSRDSPNHFPAEMRPNIPVGFQLGVWHTSCWEPNEPSKTENGCATRHLSVNGPEDPGGAWAIARLRHRPPYRAD